MPFGSFWVQIKGEQNKKKKVKPAKERPEKIKPMKEKQDRKSKEKESAPVFTSKAGSVGYQMSVLLVGHSQRTICNFLCSMNVNMNEMAGETGLAFYTEDHQTMSRMIAAKKELDGIFYNRRGVADELEERDLEGRQVYSFRISLAGRQSRCLEFSFTCVTEEELAQISIGAFDAVWILEELPYLEKGAPISGLYQLFEDPQQAEGKPVLLLAAQFEYLERFRVVEEESSLSEETKAALKSRLETLWQQICGENRAVCQMEAVQIYGGLEFTGWDAQGRARLEASKSGFYQRYIPFGCQMPLIYTANAYAGDSPLDFFHSDDGNALITRLLQVFHPYCQNEALKAEPIGGLSNETEI